MNIGYTLMGVRIGGDQRQAFLGAASKELRPAPREALV